MTLESSNSAFSPSEPKATYDSFDSPSPLHYFRHYELKAIDDSEAVEEDLGNNLLEEWPIMSLAYRQKMRRSLPQLHSSLHLYELADVLEDFVKSIQPSDRTIAIRKAFITDLRRLLQEKCSGSRLKLFGSSASGFATESSDLDLTMVFAEGSREADTWRSGVKDD
ncbi:unnamed protein product [Rodentolepis nana]|uniref:RNA uridylyltransferase n=1 Tax=Rodentolepis nana TaxID=102285 RepID=A0A0R3U0E7_RODNA|nr:unnamed protein product [Rodentolepis nana]